jgi:Bacterial Ig-like domain (group 3)
LRSRFDPRNAPRPRLSRPSFHFKSAIVGLFCVVVLLLFAWLHAAQAQAEIISVTTTATIGASPNPAAPDVPITFTAQIEADRGAVPGGYIDFIDESTMLCLGRASVASPSITVSDLAPGAHRIRAHYIGTTAFLPFVALPSSSAILVENVQAVPRLEVSTSHNPSAPGEPLMLLATISAGAGRPTGTVTFRDGDVILAAGVRLDRSGHAAFTTSILSGGAHAISAEYEGDVRFAKALATVRQDVGDAPVEPFRIGQDRS